MTATLTATRGLPASGKSTWAKEQVVNSSGKIKRVNKDDLRAMIDANGPFSKEKEKLIEDCRNSLVTTFLQWGYEVICDDTNLNPYQIETLGRIARECNANFVINDAFLSVDIYTCLERNSKRSGRENVPENVIWTMMNNWNNKWRKDGEPFIHEHA